MPINGHNASHYYYVHPSNEPKWTNDIHKRDLTELLGFDPYLNNTQMINGKTFFEHFSIPFAKGFRLTTTYPGLIIGAGYSHYAINEGEDSDYQLGFFFDHTLGVPIIPGSSIKGVLKNVFPDSGDKRKKEKLEYINEIVKKVLSINEDIITYTNWKKIFFENNNSFFHAFPIRRVNDGVCKQEYKTASESFEKSKVVFEKTGKGLEKKIEILKNNHSKNEQEKNQLRELEQIKKKYEQAVELHNEALEKYKISQRLIVDDAITPHPKNIFKEPKPIKFIKVPAGIEFEFQFKINKYEKNGIKISHKEILNIFKQILIQFGICAKRNVGYGHFI